VAASFEAVPRQEHEEQEGDTTTQDELVARRQFVDIKLSQLVGLLLSVVAYCEQRAP
jgi:hypothetical protein